MAFIYQINFLQILLHANQCQVHISDTDCNVTDLTLAQTKIFRHRRRKEDQERIVYNNNG